MQQTEKHPARVSSWLITAAAIVVALGGCNDDGVTPPSEGSIQVTVTTTGTDIDPDGYSLLLDGGGAQVVGANGSITFSSVAAGSHEVTLQGIAANCSVTQANPATVAVVGGETANVSFSVVCAQLVIDLEVVTITTGQDIDADGYTFAVDGGTPQSIGVNDSVTVGAAPGTRSVALEGVANNCTPAGANPRSVTVPTSGSARVEFVVSCTSVQGSLVVTTTTTGVDFDPDGYTVTADGGISQPIGASATVTINNVPAGDRTVTLTGVADNCTVTAPHPRTVTVVAGSSIQTDFEIVCENIPGTVEVVTATTGVDIDSNGYTVTVEGQSPQFIDVNDTVSVSGVVWGDRTVTLSNLDSNCTVTGDNPRTVTVPQRDTVETVFDVTCVALTGALTVIASTTGSDLDADGYMVSVDGGPAQALPTNGQVVFNNAMTGDRSVLLTGIAPNCSVTGDNPATVTVPPQGNVDHTFDVTCSTLVGSVEVTTATTGSSVDPDGYSVIVGALAPVAIGVNATETVGSVPIGMRSVELTGVASNCTVAGQNPRMVNVTEGGTAMTTFDVTCFTPISNKIVFDSNRDGVSDIYVMNPNGTGVVRLTTDPDSDAEPNISPDGTKIAFVSDRDGSEDIWVMNADGTNQVNLTNNGFVDRQPVWSHDGSKIAFRSNRNGNNEIWVMNADGTGALNLTNDAADDGLPDWSPDGTKIVFSSNRDGDAEIYVMDADGSNVVRLTSSAGPDYAASWSPSGAQIAFTSERDGDAEIFVMNANGSNQTQLTFNNGFFDGAPQWSPNGDQIAFASGRDGNVEVYTMTSAGGSQTNVTNNAAADFEVDWR
jgi:Tol biopolymer transport system component